MFPCSSRKKQVPIEGDALPDISISKTVTSEEHPTDETASLETEARLETVYFFDPIETLGNLASGTDFPYNPEIKILEVDGMIETIHMLKDDQTISMKIRNSYKTLGGNGGTRALPRQIIFQVNLKTLVVVI